MAIHFHDDKINSGLRGRRIIGLWIKEAIRNEKKTPGSINIILTGDKELREINKTYLSADYYTDIFSTDVLAH